jgi:hypothetical protein
MKYIYIVLSKINFKSFVQLLILCIIDFRSASKILKRIAHQIEAEKNYQIAIKKEQQEEAEKRLKELQTLTPDTGKHFILQDDRSVCQEEDKYLMLRSGQQIRINGIKSKYDKYGKYRTKKTDEIRDACFKFGMDNGEQNRLIIKELLKPMKSRISGGYFHGTPEGIFLKLSDDYLKIENPLTSKMMDTDEFLSKGWVMKDFQNYMTEYGFWSFDRFCQNEYLEKGNITSIETFEDSIKVVCNSCRLDTEIEIRRFKDFVEKEKINRYGQTEDYVKIDIPKLDYPIELEDCNQFRPVARRTTNIGETFIFTDEPKQFLKKSYQINQLPPEENDVIKTITVTKEQLEYVNNMRSILRKMQ